MRRKLARLLGEIRACRICEAHLPLGPRPIVVASTTARIVVIGQAPGTKVHATGIPWNDASGERLRAWMGIYNQTFYDSARIAIVPQGFCYPGRGKNGDLPPRPECAATWHPRLFPMLPALELYVLVGRYAQVYHLGPRAKKTLGETVRAWRSYLPRFLPVPHPSWHNNHWLALNPWFEAETVPALREAVGRLLDRDATGVSRD